MPSKTSRPMTVRVRNELYREASILADVQGVSIRNLVEQGLQSEVSRRLDEGGSQLARAIEAVRDFRGPSEGASV